MNATLRNGAGAGANCLSLGRATPASPFRHTWLGQGPAMRGLSMSCVLAALWGCTASVEGGAAPGAGATTGAGGTTGMGSSGGSGVAAGGAASTVGTPLEVKLNGAPV